MILIDNSQVKVEYLAELNCIKYAWFGQNTGEYIRQTYEKILEFAIKWRAKNWLSDLKEAELLEKEDMEWFIQDWLPRAAANLGFGHHWAIVSSEDILMRMGIKVLTQEIKQSNNIIQIKYFDTMPEALDWLKEEIKG